MVEMFSPGVRERMARSSLIIGYLVLALGAIIGFAVLQSILDDQRQVAERIELEGMIRAHENCQNVNQVNLVIQDILRRIVEAPPEGLTDAQVERRENLYDDLVAVLEPNECPPLPESIGSSSP